MQVCTLFQTDSHASTSPLSFFTDQMPFLPPNQQRQSTEGKYSQHHQEENDKQQGGQATALLCAIRHFKVWRHFTVLNDTCPHAFMEGADDRDSLQGSRS